VFAHAPALPFHVLANRPPCRERAAEELESLRRLSVSASVPAVRDDRPLGRANFMRKGKRASCGVKSLSTLPLFSASSGSSAPSGYASRAVLTLARSRDCMQADYDNAQVEINSLKVSCRDRNVSSIRMLTCLHLACSNRLYCSLLISFLVFMINSQRDGWCCRSQGRNFDFNQKYLRAFICTPNLSFISTLAAFIPDFQFLPPCHFSPCAFAPLSSIPLSGSCIPGQHALRLSR
jgi:hypothetical protein